MSFRLKVSDLTENAPSGTPRCEIELIRENEQHAIRLAQKAFSALTDGADMAQSVRALDYVFRGFDRLEKFKETWDHSRIATHMSQKLGWLKVTVEEAP